MNERTHEQILTGSAVLPTPVAYLFLTSPLLAGGFPPPVAYRVPGNHSTTLLFRDVLIDMPGKREPLGFVSVYQTTIS